MFNPETPPELSVSGWLNAPGQLSLERLRGRVVVVVAFQMLCSGCVEHAIPQAKRLCAKFNPNEVAIIGLHSVFEHHNAMSPEALEVFVSEFKLPFPVAIDQPDGDGMPLTMAAYQMQGTPTFLIFDRAGRLRRHYFGKPDDIMLSAELMALAIEDKASPRHEAAMIEKKLALTLVSEHHDHGHDHHHEHDEACGCGHDHHHDGDHSAHDDSDRQRERAEDIAQRLSGAERMTEPPNMKPGR